MLLVGDVGATHARLALISRERGLAQPIREATLQSQHFDSLESVLQAFLEEPPSMPVERAVLAVAGPVVRGEADLTNLGWVADEGALGAALGIPSVRLLNDLVALASGVPQLSADELCTLQRGEPEEQGPVAVVAPGTGLGEAFVTWDGAAYTAHASEGGHADFAPGDALQIELLNWLRRRFDHVSYERVCSGHGLPNLYDFLVERGVATEDPRLAEHIAAAPDRTIAIMDAALDERAPSALCASTIELFASILAAEAGNAGLRVVATGGVYLGGGIPRRILRFLQRGSAVERFRSKGRISPLVDGMPLHVVVAQGVALRGATYVAMRER